MFNRRYSWLGSKHCRQKTFTTANVKQNLQIAIKFYRIAESKPLAFIYRILKEWICSSTIHLASLLTSQLEWRCCEGGVVHRGQMAHGVLVSKSHMQHTHTFCICQFHCRKTRHVCILGEYEVGTLMAPHFANDLIYSLFESTQKRIIFQCHACRFWFDVWSSQPTGMFFWFYSSVRLVSQPLFCNHFCLERRSSKSALKWSDCLIWANATWLR